MSSSASGSVPTTLTTIPVEIFYQIISGFNKVEALKLRLVCREINQRTLDGFRPHSYYFRQIVGEFTHKGLHHILKIAHYPPAQRFVRDVRIPMTRKWRRLGSPRSPGWKRDSMGYIAHPDQVYEICTLKKIMKMLPDCKQFRLTYDINENKKKGQWRGSLKFTIETILAICAAAEVNIKGIELSDHHDSLPTFTVNQGRPLRPWDKSKPLLDTACALIPALQLTMDPETKDLDWVEAFVAKCTNLEQLSVEFLGNVGYNQGQHHRFFNDIAVTPALLPPVKALMLETNGFTMSEIVGYVGRFKNSAREFNLCRVNLDGDGWPAFLNWLRENMPSLEKFEFQVLHHGHGKERETVCFDSIYDKNPDLIVEISPKRVYRTACVKLTGGTLEIHHSNKLPSRDNWEVMKEIADGTFKWNDIPYEVGPAYSVQYEGSNVGAREALRLLSLSGVPQVLNSNSAHSNMINVL